MVEALRPGGPGTSSHAAAVDAAKQIMVMTVHGKEYRLALGNVPPMEKILVRKATGMPYEAFLGDGDSIGEDSVFILCWLAERAAGNKMLTLPRFAETWQPVLSEGDLSVDMVDADDSSLPGDDPES